MFDSALSIISFLYRVVADLVGWRRKRGKPRLTPAERVKSREKWKPIIEGKLREYRRDGSGRDCILHDIDRLDAYPEIMEGRGISAWFRVGLMGTTHNAVLLGLGWTLLVEDKATRQLRYPDRKKAEQGNIKCMLMGYVPYQSIESINWDGDEYYNKPHIFVHFEQAKGEPYERVAFCEQRFLDEFEYWTDLAEAKAVIKLTKKRRIKDYF